MTCSMTVNPDAVEVLLLISKAEKYQMVLRSVKQKCGYNKHLYINDGSIDRVYVKGAAYSGKPADNYHSGVEFPSAPQRLSVSFDALFKF